MIGRVASPHGRARGGVIDRERVTPDGELASATVIVFDPGVEGKAWVPEQVTSLW